MEKLLSVIVAMYNAEKYIAETLDSILWDKDERIEVIVVDDGSTDKSVSFCSEVGDQRLVILKQNNQGAPVARNEGLRVANGEYVMFFDADDIIEKGALKIILQEINKEKHDCYIGNFYRFDGMKAKLEYKSIDYLKSRYDFYMYSPSLSNKVFNKSVLNKYGIKFENLRLAQDLNFYLKFLGISNDIKVIDQPFFYYRYVENSISHVVDVRILDIVKSVDRALEFYELNNVSEEYAYYVYLVGIKHTNYQMIKILESKKFNEAYEWYMYLVKNWNRMNKNAKKQDCQFIIKKLIDNIIQYKYRYEVRKHLRYLKKLIRVE